METDRKTDRKYRNRELPDLFWDALWQVRDCLLKDKVHWHYYRGDELFPHSVFDALCVIDSWMKAMVVDDE